MKGRIGVSTACFYPLALEKAIDEIARLGIPYIEVFINAPSEFSPDFIKNLRERVDAHGMEVVSVHPFTSMMEGMLLFTNYPRRQQDGLSLYQSYFAAAAALGARFFTFHGERLLQGADLEDSTIEAYGRLCQLAKKEGIVFAQENVAWCKSADLAYLKRLYNEVDSLRFTLDVKQARRAHIDPLDYLEIMGERLVNVHINDFSETESCLLPAQGSFDFRKFAQSLADKKYVNKLLIEVYSQNYKKTDEIRGSYDFLSPFFD